VRPQGAAERSQRSRDEFDPRRLLSFEPMIKWSSWFASPRGSARYRLGSRCARATVALRTSKPLIPGCNSRRAFPLRSGGSRPWSPKPRARVRLTAGRLLTLATNVPDVLATLRTLRRSGSTPTVASAGMEQKWLAVLISRRSVGAIPTPATPATTRSSTVSYAVACRVRSPPLARREAIWREAPFHTGSRTVRFRCLALAVA